MKYMNFHILCVVNSNVVQRIENIDLYFARARYSARNFTRKGN
jgi:hypothetical protein